MKDFDYSRQIMLPEIGEAGQAKLKAARILVIGAGGLGCPVLQYLAAAGIGTLGIVDSDVVDASNLHRQILYGPEDIGKRKVKAAAARLTAMAPGSRYELHNLRLDAYNGLDLVHAYDVIVDGSDNFATRYLLDDACVIADKPLVSGAVFRFEGQVTVLSYRGGPTYRCLFPEPPEAALNCDTIGVLGPVPGLVGTMQALEVIKIVTGAGDVLSGRLWIYDGLTTRGRTLNFTRNDAAKERAEAHLEKAKRDIPIETILPADLVTDINRYTLLDVREPEEVALCVLDDALIVPLGELERRINELPRDRPLVAYCHHGRRSEPAARILLAAGFPTVLSLAGGIDAWATDIDQTMARY